MKYETVKCETQCLVLGCCVKHEMWVKYETAKHEMWVKYETVKCETQCPVPERCVKHEMVGHETQHLVLGHCDEMKHETVMNWPFCHWPC